MEAPYKLDILNAKKGGHLKCYTTNYRSLKKMRYIGYTSEVELFYCALQA